MNNKKTTQKSLFLELLLKPYAKETKHLKSETQRFWWAISEGPLSTEKKQDRLSLEKVATF